MKKRTKRQVAVQNVFTIPVSEQDRSPTIPSNTALKLIQIVQNAHLGMMFKGYAAFLEANGMKFRDLSNSCFILFINRRRDYIKLVIGNHTDNPVILAYRFPSGTSLPAHALKQVIQTFLRRGDIHSKDARLVAALQETREDAAAKRARLVN